MAGRLRGFGPGLGEVVGPHEDEGDRLVENRGQCRSLWRWQCLGVARGAVLCMCSSPSYAVQEGVNRPKTKCTGADTKTKCDDTTQGFHFCAALVYCTMSVLIGGVVRTVIAS